jgi:hypothetical protein
MTLNDILSDVDCYYERDEETGVFHVYDDNNENFEEIAHTVKGVLSIVDGRLHNLIYYKVDDYATDLQETILYMESMTYQDFYDWLSSRKKNIKQKINLKFDLELLDCIINPDKIELDE